MTGEIYRKEILPYYLMITDGCGINTEYIDNSCPTELEPYEIAYNLKMKQKDSFAYACVGNYVTSAVLVAVDHCLNGRKAKYEYTKERVIQDESKISENYRSNEQCAVYEMKQRINLLRSNGLPESPD